MALVASACATRATAQDVRFRSVGIDQGLPSSLVSDVMQDRHGFLWVGTGRGVARYDGARFRTYRPLPGDSTALPTGLADRVYEDRVGRVWVVSQAGVSRFDPSRDAFRTIAATAITADVAPRRAAGPPITTALLQDRAHRLWVGTNVGLYRLDAERGDARWLPLAGAAGGRPSVTVLHEDTAGVLWVGTRDGLFAVTSAGAADGRGAPRIRHLGAGGPAAAALPDAHVRALADDARGRLWIGTQGGIAVFDRALDRVVAVHRHDRRDSTSLARDRVARLLADRSGRGMWVGTENGGLDFFDQASGGFSHHVFDPDDPSSLGSNSVWALHQDRQGVLWVGTFTGGLAMALPNAAAIGAFRPLPGDPRGLSYGATPGFAEADGAIWVATDGGGLNRFDPRTRKFERFTSANTALVSDAVLSVAPDPDGSLWLGTWAGGIARFDPRARTVTAYTTANSDIPDDNVYEVLVDRAGALWIGTDDGVVARFDRAARRFTRRYEVVPPGHAASSVLLLRELRDGRFAIALRDGGLVLLDPATGRRRHYLARRGTAADGAIASDQVRALHESEPGVLWVGGENGLDRLDLRRGTRTHFTEADGLASPFVAGVASDGDGALWVSSDRGLTRLDPARRLGRTYTRFDGVSSGEFLMRAAFRASDGTLYFGGSQGFTTVVPRRLRADGSAPPLVLTDLSLFSTVVPPGAPGSPLARMIYETPAISLRARDNVVTFGFAALDFVAPGAVRYAYRLEGFDTRWQDVANRRTASYTNLAPGRYTFEVRARNRDGAWDGARTALTVVVTPPVWQTWWFRLALAAAALAALNRVWRFQQQRRLERALARQALHDTLTGLANRVLFRDRVEHALSRLARGAATAERAGQPRGPSGAAVLFLDLDGFKAINDTLGHQAGDAVLCAVSARLRQATREYDTVARFGGDEFAVLVEQMQFESDAQIVADRILEAVRHPIPLDLGGQRSEGSVGVSIGIAYAEPGMSVDELLRRADSAMYDAKRGGKGHHATYDALGAASTTERHDLEQSLRVATARRQCSLAYQPIVALRDGRVVGAEALLRWRHPTRGDVSPADFIPLAESAGLIGELGAWVLHEACRAASRWPAGPSGDPIAVAVNVSGRQLVDARLVGEVAAALADSGLPADRLTLEVTETALVRDREVAARTLRTIRALGVHVAVDDFGVGQSSLGQLQLLPVDVLKVDKSFVDVLATDAPDPSLLRMIVELGRARGLRVVAEGVEQEVQRGRLLALGCAFAQGYLFARPVSDEALCRLLAAGGVIEIGGSEIGAEDAALAH